MKRIFAVVALTCSLHTYAQSGLQQRLDSLTTAYEANGFQGVIRIAKGNQLLYEKGYGLANREKNIRNTTATLFKTESVGKMFTAVSVLQLVEQGKLRLQTTVQEILPDLHIKNADKITVHHLLTHTSGLQSPWDDPKWSFKKTYTRAQLQQIIEEVPPAFDSVGKEMYYSNSGFIILAWMVEKVSGQPFDQYYRQHIFQPLHMTYTWHLNDTLMPVKTGAQPYRQLSSKRYIPMNETVGALASGAGGWISTAGDLQLFMTALNSGKLLQPATLKLMRTANQTAPADSMYQFYAYGLETYHNMLLPGVDLYGHNGGGAGFSIDAFADPASGVVITSCTNLYQNSRPIMENYLRAVYGLPLNPVVRPATVRLYDVIEEKGLDYVLAHTDSVFKKLNIMPHPGFVGSMSNVFLEAKDYIQWSKWIDWAQTAMPDEPFLKVVYADGLLQMGKKEEARKSYEAAKQLALQKNDQRALHYAEAKMKSL
jgi:CubicO group peptidase (beta-lactamase class C family)